MCVCVCVEGGVLLLLLLLLPGSAVHYSIDPVTKTPCISDHTNSIMTANISTGSIIMLGNNNNTNNKI